MANERAARMARIEDYVRQTIGAGIAHDFKHVDRVRHWAVRIAQAEGYGDLEVVAAAALLHDIAFAQVEDTSTHAQVGAEMAATFLRANHLFPEEQIDDIAAAIRSHSSLSGGGQLGEILRDADMLDAFGAVGLMRAFTSKHAKPEYDPTSIKGETWGMSAAEFTQRFRQGTGIGPSIVDQVNFQISCYDNLRTEAAKRWAEPLVAFMRTYLLQLEAEIMAGRGSQP